MDFTTEGLRYRAFELFALLQTKRLALPPKLTPEIQALSTSSVKDKVSLFLDHNLFFKRCIREALVHNSDKAASKQVGLFVVIFLDQLQSLEKEDFLQKQVMGIKIKDLKDLRLPSLSKHMQSVKNVCTRVEMCLTQEADAITWDFNAFNFDSLIIHENDIDIIEKRISREFNIPKEQVQKWVYDRGNVCDTSNLLIHLMRSCHLCHKFGFKLSKCGACLETYYCSEQCQHDDWKEHKKICRKKNK
jgi:hypothetical protein